MTRFNLYDDCNDTDLGIPSMASLDSCIHPTTVSVSKVVSRRSVPRARTVSVLMALSISLALVPVQGFASLPSLWTPSSNRGEVSKTNLDMYLQPNSEPSHNGPWVGQVFFNSERSRKNPLLHSNRRKRVIIPNSHGKKQSMLKYSRSILTSTDTLPSFSTAHGLLSPVTVMRMEYRTRGSRSEPLEYFFQHYRRNGPMACLPFLADMNVLPHLTEAMREISSDS